MAKLILEGDTQAAGRWVGFAKSKLFGLRESMKPLKLPTWFKRYEVAVGVTVYISSMMGTEIIRIIAAGGAFVVVGISTDNMLNAFVLDPGAFTKRSSASTAGSGEFVYNPAYHSAAMLGGHAALVYGTRSGSLDGAVSEKVGAPGSPIWNYEAPITKPFGWAFARAGFTGASLYEDELFLTGYANSNTALLGNKLLICRVNPSTGAQVFMKERWEGTDIETSANECHAIASGLYIAGLRIDLLANTRWFVEKASRDSGAMQWVQNVTSPEDGLTISSSTAYGVFADGFGVYAAGRRKEIGLGKHHVWRVERRDLTTGAKVWHKTYDPGVDSAAVSVIADADFVYVSGSYGTTGRVEKRDKASGDLVWGAESADLVPRQLRLIDGKLYVFGYNPTTLVPVVAELKLDDGAVRRQFTVDTLAGFFDDGSSVMEA